MFLEEYAKDLDDVRAAAAVDISLKYVRGSWLKEEKFVAEIERIHDVFRDNLRMTAETAASRHIKLMDKIEGDYDGASEIGDKAKLATPLAKMSDSYLKAAGHFNHGATGGDAQVVINIDLGGDTSKDVKDVIDVEVVDE